MLTGFSGTLLSRQFVELVLPVVFAGRLGETGRDRSRRAFRRWWRTASSMLGPASSVRTVFDRGAMPLVELLGFRTDGLHLSASEGPGVAALGAAGQIAAGMLVSSWGLDLRHLWREAVREGIKQDVRWCYVFNGARLGLVDVRRTYTRHVLEVDLESATGNASLFALLWGTMHARAVTPGPAPGQGRETSLIDEMIDISDRHATAVCESLGEGVRSALVRIVSLAAGLPRHGRRCGTPRPRVEDLFEPSLVIVYRLLFLLFAEARGLVPVWHPVYRESYSLEGLSRAIQRNPRFPGLWESLEAITRLAGRGCRAGDLQVTPFNGRLFASGATAALEASLLRRRIRGAGDPRDAALRDVILGLTTRAEGPSGRERIAYADLGVEQLGAVYEGVLDYAPVVEPGTPSSPPQVTLQSIGRRKATGSFYTPRSLTDFLVRRTLSPLVEDASPDTVLSLRVLDPAMGSGAFLVAACRYLATAYESALVSTGACDPGEISDDDRATFRRTIAQRCLYGVDINPMAVQLGRLSLWLATLAVGRPLTFLDHNLRTGDSLSGASLADLGRQPPPRGRRAAPDAWPLFGDEGLETALEETVGPRLRLAVEPGDDLAAVSGKERLHRQLTAGAAPLSRWRRAVDLWCAVAFWPDRRQAPRTGEFWALVDQLLGKRSTLPARIANTRLEEAGRIARARAFFHFTLEYPEVFYEPTGRPAANRGFDAIVGNPPWEVLRADPDGGRDRAAARADATGLQRFIAESGVYRLQGDGHPNLYQLFLERALTLVRRGGRIGLVLPSGLATDRGSAALRRELLTRCQTDAVVSFDNRHRIFPIHRSYRFLLVTATVGGDTGRLRCRFGERSAAALDALPDSGGGTDAFPVVLSAASIRRLGGPGLTIPELRTGMDLAIAEKAAAGARPLGDRESWGASFGRELNATDDKALFVPAGRGLPVLEGKLIRPFCANVSGARHAVPLQTLTRRLDRATTFGRARLAYRDVASATNERSLIAAVLPPDTVTTHTLMCLKADLDVSDQWVLCAMLNSLVTNFLVRQRMGTHVTATIAMQLPVPRPQPASSAHAQLESLAKRLSDCPDDLDAAATLEALVARVYDLTRLEFAHVLQTFPLVSDELRRRALARV
jgi:hypothetical protein